MYIGNTGAYGLHHLVYEVVDNSVDEAMAGYCDSIKIVRSTPTARSPSGQRPRHPGGNPPAQRQVGRRSRNDRAARRAASSSTAAYKVAGGLHGVGVSVVNALCRVARGARCGATARCTQRVREGHPHADVDRGGPVKPHRHEDDLLRRPEIFGTIDVQLRHPVPAASARWPTCKGTEDHHRDERHGPRVIRSCFEGGMRRFVST